MRRDRRRDGRRARGTDDGGELGDYANYKVDGIINSKSNVEALDMYAQLYKFTPPNWGKTLWMKWWVPP